MPRHKTSRLLAWDDSRKYRFWANLVLLLVFWADLCINLSLEWEINPQYSYGYLVPFLGLYLLYSRWEDRPPVTPGRLPGWILPALYAIVVVLLVPLRIIFEANPDWRLIMWAHALLLFTTTMVAVYAFGSRAWVVHFFWGWVFLLIAIPWPMRLETPLVQSLMRMVAAVSVEVLNLIGINAAQAGNLIRLPNTLVGVEEACSGVRSFQSAIMAALFFGEFFSYRLGPRLLLIVGGILLSVFLNLIRTFALTLIAHLSGPEEMSRWHDPIGYFVYFGSFGMIFIASFAFRKKVRQKESYPVTRSPFLRGSSRGLLPLSAAVVFVSLLLAGWITGQLFYRLQEEPAAYFVSVDARFAALDTPVREIEISDAVQAQLRFEEGRQVVWADPQQQRSWTVFFFSWEKGDISSFAGVHRPEICLQAAGLILTETGPTVRWSRGLFDMALHTYTFRAGERRYHVFFAVWERENGRPVPIDRNYRDRLARVREGIRAAARQSLQIVITGAPDLESATAEAITQMERFLEVEIEPGAGMR